MKTELVRRRCRAALGGMLLVFAASAAAEPLSWEQVPAESQMLLHPVAAEWERLAPAQQERLQAMAERASARGASAEAFFVERLQVWAGMTPQERQAVHERPLRVRKIPRQDIPEAAAPTDDDALPTIAPLSVETTDAGDAVIGNPGQFMVSIIGGLLAIAEEEFELVDECDSDIDPTCEPPDELANFPIDIEADGSLTVPVGEDLLPPVELEVDGDVVTITFDLPQQPSGSIDPLTGAASLGFGLSVHLTGSVSGVSLGSNCRIGTESNPILISGTTGISGELEGEAYDGETSSMTLVDGSFEVPGASGCGGVLSFIVTPILNGQLGLPSGAGDNAVVLTVELDPTVIGPLAAVPQSVETIEDTPVDILLEGDSSGGDALDFEIVTEPENGTLDVANLPMVTYTPESGFVGTDSFEFRVLSGGAASEPATVTILVGQANVPPVAEAQSVATKAGQAVDIELEASDEDGDTLSFAIVDAPANGTVELIGDRTVRYIPAGGFGGQDSFTFLANDGFDDSNIAPVFITVEALDTALHAEPAMINLTLRGLLTSINLGEMRATLSDENGEPVEGKTLEFLQNDQLRCTAVTGADGSAGCRGGSLGAGLAFILGAGYDVRFAGDAAYRASHAHGRVFR